MKKYITLLFLISFSVLFLNWYEASASETNGEFVFEDGSLSSYTNSDKGIGNTLITEYKEASNISYEIVGELFFEQEEIDMNAALRHHVYLNVNGDDDIVNYIDKDLFFTTGKYLYSGAEYGFYINTRPMETYESIGGGEYLYNSGCYVNEVVLFDYTLSENNSDNSYNNYSSKVVSQKMSIIYEGTFISIEDTTDCNNTDYNYFFSTSFIMYEIGNYVTSFVRMNNESDNNKVVIPAIENLYYDIDEGGYTCNILNPGYIVRDVKSNGYIFDLENPNYGDDDYNIREDLGTYFAGEYLDYNCMIGDNATHLDWKALIHKFGYFSVKTVVTHFVKELSGVFKMYEKTKKLYDYTESQIVLPTSYDNSIYWFGGREDQKANYEYIVKSIESYANYGDDDLYLTEDKTQYYEFNYLIADETNNHSQYQFSLIPTIYTSNNEEVKDINIAFDLSILEVGEEKLNNYDILLENETSFINQYCNDYFTFTPKYNGYYDINLSTNLDYFISLNNKAVEYNNGYYLSSGIQYLINITNNNESTYYNINISPTEKIDSNSENNKILNPGDNIFVYECDETNVYLIENEYARIYNSNLIPVSVIETCIDGYYNYYLEKDEIYYIVVNMNASGNYCFNAKKCNEYTISQESSFNVSIDNLEYVEFKFTMENNYEITIPCSINSYYTNDKNFSATRVMSTDSSYTKLIVSSKAGQSIYISFNNCTNMTINVSIVDYDIKCLLYINNESLEMEDGLYKVKRSDVIDVYLEGVNCDSPVADISDTTSGNSINYSIETCEDDHFRITILNTCDLLNKFDIDLDITCEDYFGTVLEEIEKKLYFYIEIDDNVEIVLDEINNSSCSSLILSGHISSVCANDSLKLDSSVILYGYNKKTIVNLDEIEISFKESKFDKNNEVYINYFTINITTIIETYNGNYNYTNSEGKIEYIVDKISYKGYDDVYKKLNCSVDSIYGNVFFQGYDSNGNLLISDNSHINSFIKCSEHNNYLNVQLKNSICVTSWGQIENYYGIFNGNGYTLSGININNSNYSMFNKVYGQINNLNIVIDLMDISNNSSSINDKYAGVALFSYGRIYNVNLTYKQINVSGNNHNIGGIAYSAYKSNISSCNVDFCNITFNSGNNYFGGILYSSTDSTISNCSVYLRIRNTQNSSNYIGGISCYNYSPIYNCSSNGYVYTCGDFGGIVNKNYGEINNCKNYVGVNVYYLDKNCIVGGIAATLYSNSLIGCYNYGSICYSSSKLSDNRNVAPIIGGVIGYKAGGTYTNCYNNGSVMRGKLYSFTYTTGALWWKETHTVNQAQYVNSIVGK